METLIALFERVYGALVVLSLFSVLGVFFFGDIISENNPVPMDKELDDFLSTTTRIPHP